MFQPQPFQDSYLECFAYQENRRLSCATVWQLKKCKTVLCNYTVLQAMHDANSGLQAFIVRQVAKCYNVSWQGVEMNQVDCDEEVLEELLFNLVIYADKKSSSMAEVCATKIMEDDIVYLSPYRSDCLHQHCLCTNYLAYLAQHPTLRSHPSPIRHGWELVDGRCWPICHITCSRAS